MFRIDLKTNSLRALTNRTFSEMGVRERDNLQEWILKTPLCLGEDLLFIQKEFSGFADTNERLDLLALDKQGSLVLIENKLDDTGRDVTWQAIKYASYCSGLSKENIVEIYQRFLDKAHPGIDARTSIEEFFGKSDLEEITLNKGYTQRIILIAANFRKEVTSSVLWLMNFRLRIQCFRVTPYSMDDNHFLTIEQIIPTKDVEEYMIGLADKARDEIASIEEEKNRHKVRREFWSQILSSVNQKTSLFQNISPGTQSWISAASGVRGVSFNFSAGKSFIRVELYIDRGDKADNDFIFDELFSKKAEIETAFGHELSWERIDERRACRVKYESSGNIFERSQWPQLVDAMIESMVSLERSFKMPIVEIGIKLKQKGQV